MDAWSLGDRISGQSFQGTKVIIIYQRWSIWRYHVQNYVIRHIQIFRQYTPVLHKGLFNNHSNWLKRNWVNVKFSTPDKYPDYLSIDSIGVQRLHLITNRFLIKNVDFQSSLQWPMIHYSATALDGFHTVYI